MVRKSPKNLFPSGPKSEAPTVSEEVPACVGEAANCAATHESLVRFFANSPLVGSGVKLERQRDYGRTVEL